MFIRNPYMPNTVDVYMYEAYTCIVFKIEIFINELFYLPEFDFEKKKPTALQETEFLLPILRAGVACILGINFKVFHY